MNPAPPPTDAAASMVQRAQALLDLGRADDAIPVLLQALGQVPDDHRTLCLLALAHGKAGRAVEATSWAEQAIQADPEHEWGHRLRAIYLLERGRTMTALQAAEEAARLGPQFPETLHTLARVQLRSDRRRGARETAQRMLAQSPDSFLTHEILALIAIHEQRWREAEGHCRRALAIQPHAYFALNNLGLALLWRANPFARGVGRLVEAIDCFRQAVQIDPAERTARANLTLALSRYLLTTPLMMACAFLVGVLAHAPDMTVPRVVVAVLTVIPLVLGGYCLTLGVLRYRALSPPLRDWWLRERLRHGRRAR